MEQEPRKKFADRLKSTLMSGKIVDDYISDAWKAKKEGKKIAWGEGLPFWVLVDPSGMKYLYAEVLSARLGARKSTIALDVAQDYGLASECCSYATNAIGAALILRDNLPVDPGIDLESLLYPLPDLYVNTDTCGTATMWSDQIRRILNIPTFFLQTRRIFDTAAKFEDKTGYADEIAFMVRQEKQFIAFLEELTGQPYDWEELRNIVARLKKIATLRSEIMQLAKHRPSPLSGFDQMAALAITNILYAKEGSDKLYENIKLECEARIAEGVSAVPQEKYRLLWDGAGCWARLGWLSDKLASQGACVVQLGYNQAFFAWPELIDADHPLESIAKSCYEWPHNFDHGAIADAYGKWIEEYKIDGMIQNECHTCRILAGWQKDTTASRAK